MQHFASGLRPGQTEGDTGQKFLFLIFVKESRSAEQTRHKRRRDHEGRLFSLGLAPCKLPAYGAELPLEAAKTGFSRVSANDARNGRIAKHDVILLQTVFCNLPLQQIFAGNGQLFLLGVA